MNTTRTRLAVLFTGVLAAGTAIAAGNTYYWDGTANNWDTSHWTNTTVGGMGVPGAGDVGNITNGTAIVNTAGMLSGDPSIYVLPGGTIQVNKANTTFTTNVHLAGGTFAKLSNYASSGNISVDANTTNTVIGNLDNWFVGLYGSGSLWLRTTGLQVGQNNGTSYGGNVRLGDGAAANSAQLLYATGFGNAGTVTVESNGYLYCNAYAGVTRDIPNPIVLNGGKIEFYQSHPTNRITLAADSILGFAKTGAGGNGIVCPITGDCNLTVDPAAGNETHLKRTNSYKDTALRSGTLFLDPDGGNTGSLGTGALYIASAATLALNVDQTWTLTNNITGSGTIKVGTSGARKLVLQNATVNPGTNNAPGTLTVQGSLFLSNVTFHADLASGTVYDRLWVTNSGSAVVLSNVTLAVTNTFIARPSSPVYLLMNGGSSAVTGIFTGLPEGTTVDLGNGYQAQITYQANGDSGSIGNDIALQNFSGGPLVAPTVDNGGGATNLKARVAVLRGTVTTVGNPEPKVYLCWGTSSGGTDTNQWNLLPVTSYSQGVVFSNQISGLQPGTIYYYRCFATNDSGGSWAPVTNFTTRPLAEWTFNWDGSTSDWTGGSHWKRASDGSTGTLPGIGDIGNITNGTAQLYGGTVLTGDPAIYLLPGGNMDGQYGTITLSTNVHLSGGKFWSNGNTGYHVQGGLTVDAGTTTTIYRAGSWDAPLYGNGTVRVLGSAGGGGVWFTDNSSGTYSGNVFIGDGTTACSTTLNDGRGFGSGTIQVESNAYLNGDAYGNGSQWITNPIVMNGGAFSVTQSRITGGVTLTANSTLGRASNGPGIVCPIAGNYTLTFDPAGSWNLGNGNNESWLYAANSFGAGDVMSGTVFCKVSGAQGIGSLNVRANATLAFDADTDQDWFVTNSITSVNGGTNATVSVEGGSATKTLTLCGRTLAPGGTNGVAMLKINGRLRLAVAGTTNATFAVVLNGTNLFTGANAASSYSQLKVNGNLVDLGGQNLQVTLGFAPSYADVFHVLLNGSTTATSNTFRNLPEGGTFSCLATNGRAFAAKISYVGNGDGGTLANDVMLHSFHRTDGGTSVFFR